VELYGEGPIVLLAALCRELPRRRRLVLPGLPHRRPPDRRRPHAGVALPQGALRRRNPGGRREGEQGHRPGE